MFTPNFDPTIWNRDSSDQATFFQSSIVQFWRARAPCSLSFLFLADGSTWCGLLLLESSASRFDMLCVQRCSSADLSCNEWLFELLSPFYQLDPVWPFSSDLCHQQGLFGQSRNPRRLAVSQILKPAYPAPTTMPHSKSLKSPFFPVLMLVWTSADRLDRVYMPKYIEALRSDWLIRYLC